MPETTGVGVVTCQHVWDVDEKAVDGVFSAVCKLCHEKRDFPLWPKVSAMGMRAWGRAAKIGVVD